MSIGPEIQTELHVCKIMGNPRSAGIYSVLIMSKDQANITEGKYVVLDPAQKMVIEKVAENQPKNVFLWGSSGTGKTFLITQILGMKISHYKKEGKKLNVIVSSYLSESNTSPLMIEFQNKYLEHLALEDDIHFTPFEKLCKGNNTYCILLKPIHFLNSVCTIFIF